MNRGCWKFDEEDKGEQVSRARARALSLGFSFTRERFAVASSSRDRDRFCDFFAVRAQCRAERPTAHSPHSTRIYVSGKRVRYVSIVSASAVARNAFLLLVYTSLVFFILDVIKPVPPFFFSFLFFSLTRNVTRKIVDELVIPGTREMLDDGLERRRMDL